MVVSRCARVSSYNMDHIICILVHTMYNVHSANTKKAFAINILDKLHSFVFSDRFFKTKPPIIPQIVLAQLILVNVCPQVSR